MRVYKRQFVIITTCILLTFVLIFSGFSSVGGENGSGKFFSFTPYGESSSSGSDSSSGLPLIWQINSSFTTIAQNIMLGNPAKGASTKAKQSGISRSLLIYCKSHIRLNYRDVLLFASYPYNTVFDNNGRVYLYPDIPPPYIFC